MMKKGVVSIIIISYENPALVVQRAIQSVREQTYQKYEIILVDTNDEESDYSKGLKEDIKMYPDIVYISCPGKAGEFAAAKNEGVKSAHGEFLNFLMASDAWNSEYIQRQIENLQECREAGLGFCDSWQQQENVFSIEYRKSPSENAEEYRYLEGGLFPKDIDTISQIMFRSTVFHEIQGFDENMKGQDIYDIWIRVALNYRIVGINQKLVCRYGDKYSLKNQRMQSEVIGYLQLYSKYKRLYDKNSTETLHLFEKIAKCYKNSHDYIHWFEYILKIKRLEMRSQDNKKASVE